MGETFQDLPVITFPDDAAWEAWLREHHAQPTGLWVQLARAGNDASALTRVEAVRTALCWGWIDGQIQSRDADWYLLRFTPRRARSNWSKVNVRHVEELTAQGRMQPTGLAQVEAAQADGRWDAAYSTATDVAPPPELQEALDASPTAAAAFAALPKFHRFAMCHRITNAKREDTKRRNAAKFVALLERGERLT